MTAMQLLLTTAPAVDPDAEHRETVRRVIVDSAARDHGRVNPNDVRARLAWLDVPPHIVGQTYRALRLEGRLIPDGWVTSDDVKGGNNGKPARAYRWVAP